MQCLEQVGHRGKFWNGWVWRIPLVSLGIALRPAGRWAFPLIGRPR